MDLQARSGRTEQVVDDLTAGVVNVRTRIEEAARRSGRSAGDVSVLAAVKYVDASTCVRLLEAGVHDLAENRIEQLVAKQAELEQRAGEAASVRPRWHYIGRVQSRQVGEIAQRVGMVHALASDRAARRFAQLARDGAVLPELLVQVNVARDPAKDGLLPEQLDGWFEALDERIVIAGLMTMPAFATDAEESRSAFAALRELRDALAERWEGRHPLAHLSMGTSQDFLVAVEEGATHVRLGRILYGGAE